MVEAMIAGVPVVASAVDGIMEMVTDGRDALLVAPRRGDGLAKAMIRLHADDRLREALARQARATAVGRYAAREG